MPSTKKRRPSASPAAISGQLREIIAGRGLTAYALAQAAGVSPSVVSRFLSRERGLTLETFDAIAGALGLRLIETGRGRGRPGKAPRAAPGRADRDGPEVLESEEGGGESGGPPDRTVAEVPAPIASASPDDPGVGDRTDRTNEEVATLTGDETREPGERDEAGDAESAEPAEDEPYDPWRHIPGNASWQEEDAETEAIGPPHWSS